MKLLTSISRVQALTAGAVLVALALAVLGYIYLSGSSTPEPVAEETGKVEDMASTTPDAAPKEPRRGLPPEPAFTLPAGARALDDYAYTVDDGVYFRSLTGPDPLQIPTADAGTFKRLDQFYTYSANGVVADCGDTALYTYYGDRKQIYFYQIWRTDHFRTSQIEVLAKTDPKDFEITGPLTATDGTRSFAVGHMQTATSTCLLTLTRTDR